MPPVVLQPSPIQGQGLFAGEAFVAGARILEYVGERISKEESLRRCQSQNFFIFYLDPAFDLDGSGAENLARWINHSCTPNCDATLEDGKIWIIARRAIDPGEELTFNYNYDLDEYREHRCRCQSPECAGFIVAEEFFETVRATFRVPEQSNIDRG